MLVENRLLKKGIGVSEYERNCFPSVKKFSIEMVLQIESFSKKVAPYKFFQEVLGKNAILLWM